jgi:hypothetical protein
LALSCCVTNSNSKNTIHILSGWFDCSIFAYSLR